MEEHGGVSLGLPVHIHIIFSVATTVILAVFTFFAARRKKTLVPSGIQNMAEAVVELLIGQIEPQMGHNLFLIVLPWLGSFFLYILTANWLGLFPFCFPATSDLSTTAALAATAIIGIQVINLKVNGLKGTLKEWLKPVWWLFILLVPLRIIDNLARMLSLALRLFGNLAGEHLVFEQVCATVPYILPAVLLLIGVLVGIVQSAVFTLLNLFYLVEETGQHSEGH